MVTGKREVREKAAADDGDRPRLVVAGTCFLFAPAKACSGP